MKRAVPLAAVLAACSLREPRLSSAPCSTSSQCSSANVCFLGQCRPPAANLSVVRVEVRPPSGSQFGVKEAQIDLRQSVLNDFSLAPPLPATGTVTQDGTAVPGATVTFTEHAPVIPDRVEQIASITNDAGVYSAQVPQGVWDVLVQPLAPLPPLRTGLLDTSSSSSTLDFSLPAAATLKTVDGGLVAEDGGAPIAGASVTAVDAQGAPLSVPSISQADGGYSLLLPPNASFQLQVGPAADADAGVAPAPLPTYPPQPYANTLTLPLPPIARLDVSVLDSAAMPVPSARVYVRSMETSWTLALSASADAGGQATIWLREGAYQVQAVPAADATAPAISTPQSIPLPQASPITLTCPPKVKRFGQVLGPDGTPVGANFQIVATRLADDLVPTRTFTAPTDAAGTYHLVADPGSWRFEIVPPADARLPRTVVGVILDGTDLGESALEALRISKPLQVGGTVKGVVPGAADALIANAMVSFFSVDTYGHSVFLGTGRSDAQGHYEAFLPDVAQPGGGP